MPFLHSSLIFSLVFTIVTSSENYYLHQLNGMWTELEEIKQEMISFRAQRNGLEEIARNTRHSDDTFLRSIADVIVKMDEMGRKFDNVYTKMSSLEQTVLTSKTSSTTGKDLELLRTLQRIEHTLRTPAASSSPPISDGSININTMQHLLQFTASELEKNLEAKLKDLFDAQQRLMRDLFEEFNTNFAGHRTHTHYVTSDEVPSWIQDTMVRSLNAFTDAMGETMDTKLEQFFSSVRNLCHNTSTEIEMMANVSAIGPDGRVISPRERPRASTRQRGSLQQVHPRRGYSGMGVDIIGQQPQSRQAQNLKFSVRPPVQSEYWSRKPKDCAEIYRMGYHKSGVYEAYVDSDRNTILIFCDMDTNGGGWTVIQRRDDQMIPHENFDRPWGQYKKGFGNLDGEFWIGNQNIHMLTNRGPTTLRIETVDTYGKSGYAEYNNFRVSSEFNSYMMQIGLYFEGSLKDEFTSHNNSFFSTPEEDNDKHPGRNCAETFYSGWWYDNCFRVNLNGIHVTPTHSKAIQGMYWGFKFPGNVGLRLRASEMKLRPFWFPVNRG